MGKEQPAEFYTGKGYSLSAIKTMQVLYDHVADLLSHKQDPILDLGCGPGCLAKVLKERGYCNYNGLDFSEDMISSAQMRVPGVLFIQANILEEETWKLYGVFGVFILLEVLEHIEEDLLVLEKIPVGKTVILSVPNFNHEAHVRCFYNMEDVLKRYKKLLYIDFFETIYFGKRLKRFLVKGRRK